MSVGHDSIVIAQIQIIRGKIMFISKGFKALGTAIVPILIFSGTAMASPSTIFYTTAAGQTVSVGYLNALSSAPL